MTIRRKSILVCLLLVALSLCAQTWRGAWMHGNAVKAADTSALQGAAAWQQIKRTGGETSLKAAMASVGMNASPTLGGIEQQQKLTASDGIEGDHFGESIALSGDTVVVGAPYDVIGANRSQGSAYVFTRTGTSWSPQQKLLADDGTDGSKFGSSVAIRENLIVVGARDHNNLRGAAYVFARSNGVWTQQQRLTVSTETGLRTFGGAVALSGDRIVIGASRTDIGAELKQGTAYIFYRSGTSWALQQRISASDGSGEEFFGSNVAISGDTVAVGVANDNIGEKVRQGSAYVFTYNGTLD